MTRRSIMDSATALGVALSEADLSAIDRFISLFLKWNSKINLSAARTAAEVADHVVDSLAVVPYLESATSLIDVGAGGGFPGAILAIVRPQLRVVALEPIHKKHSFLSAVRRELSVSNYDPRALRVEDWDPLDRFDLAVSRATFALGEWLTIGASLVRTGGVVLGMEGHDQTTLPSGALRHPYPAGDRTRAIISYRPEPAK